MECVILAAGEGKRMRPLTAKRPKVMLPIANRPMMEHLVVAAREAGVTDFVFVVGYGEREIRRHFGDGTSLGIHIEYATQRQQRGTADAVGAARNHITRPFLVLNGDMILKKEDIAALCRKKPSCMCTTTTDHAQDYGVVMVGNGHITSLEEKSRRPKSNLINAGAYLFSPDIFDLIDAVRPSPRGELELTDALAVLVARKQLYSHPLTYWMDVGHPWDLLEANTSFLEHIPSTNEGIIEDGVTLKNTVSVGEGSVIKAGTYIEGPCTIGKNCRIGPHAYIRGATSIGDDCHIGHCSELKNSIIMTGTKIPHFNYVGDSVVGSACNFGAGTKIANLRHDHANVRVCGKDTRRKKFGAVIGDGVQFGINCSVNVGTMIGSEAQFAPNTLIEGCIGEKTIIR
ncbi:bifunctional sugar-1-phosphate nucleotidylyltransferase/acetyltransferase [Methanoregula sp.]|uniref:bifunctional sugar-1-phosphate nucleotidylyltransferase/acetyltransferase n=1 Tax=Methanoregula sp. TaxID=2052170 RepID=UPI00261783A0|nr:bifunctional sugar-1-phosphate nucleotidylyltransferase/acetyltransferase [Methanoregula sp.]MDD5142278.1 sugar phosphate nucleotidyltransferase [Methanoregula sp.]